MRIIRTEKQKDNFAKYLYDISKIIIAVMVIGPIAKPGRVWIVQDMPKTRSGKIMRRVLGAIATGQDTGDVTTLANPQIVEEIKKLY